MAAAVAGRHHLNLIYFSGKSEMTHRFAGKLSAPTFRIPISRHDTAPAPTGPYVLATPTYGDGHGRHAVPSQVVKFLNEPTRRSLLVGVVGTGNLNFGETYALAGRKVAAKCQVPLLYTFELMGVPGDVHQVEHLLAARM